MIYTLLGKMNYVLPTYSQAYIMINSKIIESFVYNATKANLPNQSGQKWFKFSIKPLVLEVAGLVTI